MQICFLCESFCFLLFRMVSCFGDPELMKSCMVTCFFWEILFFYFSECVPALATLCSWRVAFSYGEVVAWSPLLTPLLSCWPVYVCTYVCMSVYTYICMYLYVCVCVYVYLLTPLLTPLLSCWPQKQSAARLLTVSVSAVLLPAPVNVRACVYIFRDVWVCVCVRVCVHVCGGVYVCMCTHACVFECIFICVYISICM